MPRTLLPTIGHIFQTRPPAPPPFYSKHRHTHSHELTLTILLWKSFGISDDAPTSDCAGPSTHVPKVQYCDQHGLGRWRRGWWGKENGRQENWTHEWTNGRNRQTSGYLLTSSYVVLFVVVVVIAVVFCFWICILVPVVQQNKRTTLTNQENV